MEQSIITFQANEQELVKTGGVDKFASSTVAYVEAQFTLGTNWTGFDSVRAMWRFGSDVMSTVLDHEGKCQVPHELLEKRGELKVNLVGSIVEDEVISDRLTTYPIVALIITKVAMVTSDEVEVSPSQFEQFVAIVHQDALDAEDSALESEAWAVGEKNGEAVGSGDPQYHNNAKYYAEQASDSVTDASTYASNAETSAQNAQTQALKSEGYATGRQNGQFVSADSPYYHNNASYFKDEAESAKQGAELAEQGAESAKQAIEDLSVTASVDANVGTPSVVVTKSTVDDHENIDIALHNLKGNGISSIAKTGTSGLVDTYTITFTDGTTTTFNVTNGTSSMSVSSDGNGNVTVLLS